MRNFTILLSLMLMASMTFGQSLNTKTKVISDPVQLKASEQEKSIRSIYRATDYEINFEDVEDFSLEFTPWTTADVDGLPTYGITDVSFPHAGEPMAFICFNPDETDPPLSDDPEIQPHSGERYGACFSSIPEGGQGNDDWLMTPQITIEDGSFINFWARSYTDQWGLERFNVAVSTTGNDPGDFEVISGDDYLEAPMAWTEYNFDLSDYAGMEIYVAIQCVSYDAFIFMIDDIVVDPGTGPSACENFDELPVDSYVAEELPMWTTWSGTPGSDEDAMITNVVSNSPENSFVSTGSTDLVQLFSDASLTEGAYSYSNYINVAPDAAGYWNLQKDTEPGVEWGIEVYYYPDGTAEVYAGSETPYTFNFDPETWLFNEVIVDLDNDWAEFYADGEMIAAWEWHLGASGDGSLISLGGANYWAWNDEADNIAYFDDVCFDEYVVPAGNCNYFEQYEDFAINFDPWTLLDVDGLPTYGITDVSFPHAGEPMAYIAFNPDETDPPLTDDPAIQPYEGDKFAACFSSIPEGGQGNNDWLISPMISLGTESMLNFFAKSYTDQWGLERFNVGISTTGIDPEDFTILNGDDYLEAPIEWTEYSYDLSDYDNQNVYVAIQCVSFDAFIFMLDEMCVLTTPTGIENPVSGSKLKVYPNPATEIVNLVSEQAINEVRIYNGIGQMVYFAKPGSENFRINTFDFVKGVYVVQINTAAGIQSKKLMIK
ncbi:MAG: choice-of-anchor J domain-containing protein [Bacteroidales bacterium]|nr:choice-of-anchor J domain-containing protein [Bacteroidales bacterium]MCF8387117.1 choice-of-anchor J domain-containing protein [Bacteroidales bacterium]MCF8398013.1 choice-of-anchor J domain-containing protein [Bacteroidales bacterium]